jgi:hypothetical protein
MVPNSIFINPYYQHFENQTATAEKKKKKLVLDTRDQPISQMHLDNSGGTFFLSSMSYIRAMFITVTEKNFLKKTIRKKF